MTGVPAWRAAWDRLQDSAARLLATPPGVEAASAPPHVPEVAECPPPPVPQPTAIRIETDHIEPPPALSPESSSSAADAIDWQAVDPALWRVMVEEIGDLTPQIDTGLRAMHRGEAVDRDEVHRLVHTLKSVVAMAGALQARSRIHAIESALEDAESLGGPALAVMLRGWDAVQATLEVLRAGPPAALPDSAAPAAIEPPRPSAALRVEAAWVDEMLAQTWAAQHAAWKQDASASDLLVQLKAADRLRHQMDAAVRAWSRTIEQTLGPRAARQDPLAIEQYSAAEGSVHRMTDVLAEWSGWLALARAQVARQRTILAEQRRAMTVVRERLRQARRVPADDINDRLYKVAWQAARDLGKSVAFLLRGGRTLVDRDVLQRLVPPIEHILRNALAHGIETPARRCTIGKPEQGRITVTFAADPERLTVSIEDDGAGLDEERIRLKAEARGWRHPQDPWSTAQAVDTISRPGFSTAEAVSEVAGRGVGMDVVRSEVLKLGGTFALTTAPGRGVTITLTVPTAAAVVPVLIARGAGRAWALPTASVAAVCRPSPADWRHAIATGLWQDRPCRGLLSSWGLPESDRGLLVTLNDPSGVWHLGVPALSPVRRLTVQALGAAWAPIRGILGAVLLEGGQIAPVLDVVHGAAIAAPPPHHHTPWALVVDDSALARRVNAESLLSLGLRVRTARDGEEAWAILATETPDLVTMDMEMPRLDGMGCLQRLRARPGGADIPVVMITSRTAPHLQEQAEALGVRGYLNKPVDTAALQRLAGAIMEQSTARPE